MHANTVSAVTAAIIATAALALTTVPSQAQTAPDVRPAVRGAAVARPPARVTVRKRTYLDPGTETKARQEHFLDYAHPDIEYGFAPMRNSTLFQSNASLPFIHDRMPFPTCLDLPGFCQ
jgi:hypothetical protein